MSKLFLRKRFFLLFFGGRKSKKSIFVYMKYAAKAVPLQRNWWNTEQSGVPCRPTGMALFHTKMVKHLRMWKKCCNFAAFYKDRTNILQQQIVRFSRVNPVNLLIRRKNDSLAHRRAWTRFAFIVSLALTGAFPSIKTRLCSGSICLCVGVDFGDGRRG